MRWMWGWGALGVRGEQARECVVEPRGQGGIAAGARLDFHECVEARLTDTREAAANGRDPRLERKKACVHGN